jgi:hypothetical protein
MLSATAFIARCSSDPLQTAWRPPKISDPMSTEIQFEKAEFSSGEHCILCQNRLQSPYFRLNGSTVCSSCAEKARFDHQFHQSQGAGLARSVLFGVGAAVVGAVIYGAIAVLTGYEFALIAIFIGWMVGKAMMRGSRGIGGRRFQVVAVLITYLSITAGYVPGIVKELINMEAKPESASEAGTAEAPATALAPTEAKAVSNPGEAPPAAAGSLFVALGFVFGIAAIAPLINLTSGISGLIGVVIIGVGLMQAWKETQDQPFALSGPFPFETRQPEQNEAPA